MEGHPRPLLFRVLAVVLLMILALNVAPSAAPGAAQGIVPPDLPPPPRAAPPAAVADPYLYPEDLDPPEACHVPRLAPFGQDVEAMLGPWATPNLLLGLGQAAAWTTETSLAGAASSHDMDVITLNSEGLLAAWRDNTDGRIHAATWGLNAGWVSSVLGAEAASGKPALLSRSPIHWALFARFANNIRIVEWYNGSLGSWQTLPGIADAASDPLVISIDPGQMAVLYTRTDGTVMFSEWEGAWLTQPISLTGPLLNAGPTGQLSSLSLVSRNDHHLAVLGIDANSTLWVRERTGRNEPDWSDTQWVALMENVAIATPAAASRHANHVGVVVKDTTGQPYYIGWGFAFPTSWAYLPVVSRSALGLSRSAAVGVTGNGPQAWLHLGGYGWKEPVPLGSASFASPMTLVARSVDSLSVFGVQSDGLLYEMVWTEDAGWGNWQSIAGPAMRTDQAVAATVRRMHDIMLLGRYSGTNQVWAKHYSSVDQAVVEEELSAPLGGYPRAQTLAVVDGKTIWLAVTREAVSGTWQVTAQELSAGTSAYLALSHGDSGEWVDRVSVAVADLDMDGQDEVVVATLQSNLTTIDISTLAIFFPTSSTLAITPTTQSWGGIPAGGDVNVALGDLDGDGVRNEAVIGYLAANGIQAGLFEATPSGLVLRNTALWPYTWDAYCSAHLDDCSVPDHDLELTIGRAYQSYLGTLFDGEQLVLLDVSHLVGECIADPSAPGCPGLCPNPTDLRCVDYAQDQVRTFAVDPLSWSFGTLAACHNLDPETNRGSPSAIAADPYTGALGTGDVDADSRAEIVYAFGDRVAAIAEITEPATCTIQLLTSLPDQERSLAVGDVDLDGRTEIVAGYGTASATDTYLVEMVDSQVLRPFGLHNTTGQHTVLAADMDNDTRVGELAGCKTFAEVTVVAVVNGVPRWYAAGQPIQSTGAQYARTVSGGGGTGDGTTTQFGASLSLGLSIEARVPIAATQLWEFRASLTEEFLGTLGKKDVTVESTTREQGYQYEGASLGMVVYDSTDFICYYYDVYPPSEPTYKTRAMVCTPTGAPPAEDFKPLEDWHSSSFKQTAGPSWVDVGHRSRYGVHSNDLDEPGNYGGQSPIDASQLKYTWPITDPIQVSYAGQGGFLNYWTISEMHGGQQEETGRFEENTILSVGASAGILTMDVTGNYGRGWEWSRVTSWQRTLEMGGSVEKYQDPTRLCYQIIPFIAHARARTSAGAVYPYLLLDYYVPWRGPCALEGGEGNMPTSTGGR